MFGLFLLLAVGGPFLLSALGVESLTIGTEGTLTYLFSFVNTAEEFSIGVDSGVLRVGALLDVVCVFVQSYRRGKRPKTNAT